MLSAAGLALRARSEGLTAERVDRARLSDRSIVLSWAMRWTLHLISAEDHGWLVPLVTEPRIANAHRRLRQEGVPPERAAAALRLIEGMLDREGPLTRLEIAERLRRRKIRTDGQALVHLLWLASADGGICYGPDRGRDRCLVLTRDWLGRPSTLEREAAATELAIRYLAAHGPAQPVDLAFWSGLRLAEAKQGWRSIEDRLTEVGTSRGPRWDLRSRAAAAPAGLVRLLPSFDEYLLGWKDRDFALPDAHRTKVNRGGGWIHQVLLDDGRVVGTWSTERTSSARRLEVHPFSRLPSRVRSGIADEAENLAAFLATPVLVVP